MPEEIVFLSIAGMVVGFFALRMILMAIFGAERMGLKSRRHRKSEAVVDESEVKILKEQVATLTDRVKVLERITVEEGSSLAAEIERLRQPEQLGYGGADDLTSPSRSQDRV